MTTAVNDFVDLIEEITNDESNDRNTAVRIISYINAAQKDIVVRTRSLGLRPAYTRSLPVQLQAGPVQTVTSCKIYDTTFKTIDDHIETIDIHRNLGRSWITGTAYLVGETVYADPADGGLFSVRYECMTAHTAGTFSTDLASVYWRTSTDLSGPLIEQMHGANLEHLTSDVYAVDDTTESEMSIWSPDPIDFNRFTVYPGQPRAESTTAAFQFVEMTYVAMPADCTVGGNLSLNALYEPAIIDYCCYRIYATDDDVLEGGTPHRSTQFYKLYIANSIFNLR